MKSSSYSPYIRDHGSRIWSTYGSSIDIFFTIFPMNWRTRRATLANSSASRSHPQPKYMHQNVSICQTSAAICAAVRELNRRDLDLTELKQPEMLQYEYARSGLKLGLKLEQELGVNPFKFGMIGSTDSHTSLATADQDNFFGKHSGAEPN